MNKIADLYTTAGLYGCTLNSAAGQTLYDRAHRHGRQRGVLLPGQ